MKSDPLLPSLHKFAPAPSPAAPFESEPLTICGDILRAAHTEIERVAADRSVATSGPKLNLEAMLGVISYCYSKGVVGSHEIEQHLWRNAAFLNAFGEDLPTAQTIRCFRRQHREAILATIERALDYFGKRQSEPPPASVTTCETACAVATSPRVRAQQMLDAANNVDSMEPE